MSSNSVERVLWDLSVNRESRRRFLDDPARYLSRYQLTDEERAMIRRFDVQGLTDRGVSTMLAMSFWMELEGSSDLEEYLKRMNAPRASPARSQEGTDSSGGENG